MVVQGGCADDGAERETLLVRGVLDMCVLALLQARPAHAYGVVQRLQDGGFAQTSYGTVYPLVTRLRRQGLLTQTVEPGEGGPARNVLRVTEAGHAALSRWSSHWRATHDRVEALLPVPTIEGARHE